MLFLSGYSDASFLATVDYDPNDPPDPIVFNVAVLNPGCHYDVTTGIYTVPLDGIYQFMVHILAVNDGVYDVYLKVDNNLVKASSLISMLVFSFIIFYSSLSFIEICVTIISYNFRYNSS